MKELDQNEIEKVISLTDIQEVLSRTFVASMAKIDNPSAVTSGIRQRIKKMVNEELQQLNQQIESIGVSIKNREAQTMQLMTIENRFQELAIDVSKKKLIFEGLKDQLKDKILTAGLANVERPVLLTKAVPPIVKFSPNKKLIVALGVVVSLFVGIAYILIMQVSLRMVHSLSQLKKISRFLNCYRIKYSQLKPMAKDLMNHDRSIIFSDALGVASLAALLIFTKKTEYFSCLEFSKTILSLLTNNSKVICLDSSPVKNPSAVAHKNLNLSPRMMFRGFKQKYFIV